MDKVKIGLVGCGRISKNHIAAIEKNERIELVAVCDVVKERADQAGKETGAKVYYDLNEMVQDPNVNTVSICTPSGMHPEHAIIAARAKKHVISEKPMGVNLELVDEMIKECDLNKVHLFVVKQNRLNATLKLVKSAFDKGRFGKIYMMQSNVFWTRPQHYYDLAKWRGTWEFDGGAYMNQASHYVDALLWLNGPVDYVMASTATMERNIEAEDTGSAIIKFRNGCIATINVTMLTYPQNLEGSITILGEKGTVKVGGIAVNRFDHWQFDEYDDDDALVKRSDYNPPNVYGFGHEGYYANVIKSLLDNEDPHTDGRSGRKSLELILAIYKSAKDGVRVSLPLQK